MTDTPRSRPIDSTYLQLDQKNLRLTTSQGIISLTPNQVGCSVILGSTFKNRPRESTQRYQDAMACVVKHGMPSLFIMVTCNPEWPEIKAALGPNDQACNRDYYLNDDDFDRSSLLTNMTVAELLAFDVAPADASLHIELSKDEPTQYSTLTYPTLQTRDAFLATDALINARKKGYRSLAVGSTCLPLGADRLWSEYDRAKDVQSWALRAQRWMDKLSLSTKLTADVSLSHVAY
ncbi:hypothetical protein MVLG_03745 [Microbotryum lychnidis-dioicae p1A1 Lamole]|uniref:Helitron helicase-like domain-containing protein n=1 Tax=Microbotryum lychnidis-dioicae (strain p1A1 Lamole / MvSl-1064) TaxID=683840 RepID=U5H951_USTV1|nr:hypothetical protein MVLG_03745 [Microbotryum lychnidis-dioicae p1A1 Lamole]|eukprot:KDE05933.1 hypothetical protein MVLG_03745 [Microbotryum lychnidis-dioicae p1A1 Lamole]